MPIKGVGGFCLQKVLVGTLTKSREWVMPKRWIIRWALPVLSNGFVGAGIFGLMGCSGTQKTREFPPKANLPKNSPQTGQRSVSLGAAPLVSVETIKQTAFSEVQTEGETTPSSQVVDPAKPIEPTKPERLKERLVGEKLSFDEVINAVLISDPRLMAGFQGINQANADALTASLVPNPTVMADILMLPLARPFSPDRTGGPPQQDVMVSYPIDWYVFGKRAAQMASASAMVKVSEAEFANLVRIRITEGALAYYDVMEAKALLDLANQNLAILAKVEVALTKAVEAGGRPKVEINRIRLDILQNRQTVRDVETALVAAKARLRALIGRSDRDLDFDIAGTLDALLTTNTLGAAEAFDLAVDNRPDVKAIRARMLQTEANVIVEDRKKYPELIPMLGWTRQYQVAAMGQPDAGSWNASLTTQLPFFNRNQGNRAKASSYAVQAKVDYEATLVALRAEIETTAQELKAARNNAEAVAGEQLRLANEVLQSITDAYEAGTRTLVEILDAQRNFRETNKSYISMRAGYWRALYRYYSATGKQIHQ